MKKNDILFESMSDIPDKFIDEALENSSECSVQRKSILWKSALTACASILLVFGVYCSLILKPLKDLENYSSTAYSSETEYFDERVFSVKGGISADDIMTDGMSIYFMRDAENYAESVNIRISGEEERTYPITRAEIGNELLKEISAGDERKADIRIGKNICCLMVGDYIYSLHEDENSNISIYVPECERILGFDRHDDLYILAGADGRYTIKKYDSSLNLMGFYNVSGDVPIYEVSGFEDMYAEDDVICFDIIAGGESKTVRFNTDDKIACIDEEYLSMGAKGLVYPYTAGGDDESSDTLFIVTDNKEYKACSVYNVAVEVQSKLSGEDLRQFKIGSYTDIVMKREITVDITTKDTEPKVKEILRFDTDDTSEEHVAYYDLGMTLGAEREKISYDGRELKRSYICEDLSGEILNAGKIFTQSDGSVLYISENALYSYQISEKISEKIMSLSDENLKSERVMKMSDGKYIFMRGNTDGRYYFSVAEKNDNVLEDIFSDVWSDMN